MVIEKIKSLASQYHKDTVQIRRHLHQYPELSFEEKETSNFIAQQLEQMGIAHQRGIADNGIVALIKGQQADSRVVALRADMDALPILEENDISYKSKNEGKMHACGHDVHTASLLGAARILNELKNDIYGTYKLIFQPGEEKLPGGASLMIKEGVLKNPTPASIIGQHVHPPLEVGKVGFRPGVYMASADELYITVKGKGGHAALPHNAVDTILITAHIIIALQQIVSRNADPTLPAVLTIGKINSTGGATNIIPAEVKLQGTFRTLNEDFRFKAHELMKNMAEQIAASMGGSCDFQVMVGYPFLKNDEVLTQKARAVAVEYLGEENVVDLNIRMTAEDFAYYSQEIPACFYRLGTGNVAKGTTVPVHNSKFNVDEDGLEIGVGLMAMLAAKVDRN
ncbi:MAG: M20 family metallopeptidase [Bacteroidota bacterium]